MGIAPLRAGGGISRLTDRRSPLGGLTERAAGFWRDDLVVGEVGVELDSGQALECLDVARPGSRDDVRRLKIARDAVGAADPDRVVRPQGAEAVGNTPEQFTAQMKADLAKWAKVVRAANIKLD